MDIEVHPGEGADLDLLADPVCLRDAAQAHDRPRYGRRAMAIRHRRPVDDRHLITIPCPPAGPICCCPPRFGAPVAPARACGRITRSPSLSPPPVTSVSVSLAMPNVASTSTGCPSLRTCTYLRVPCVLIAMFGTVS